MSDTFVYIAYYWTGWSGNGTEVLDVCDSRRTANAVIRAHKRDREAATEYRRNADWWVKRRVVRTANTPTPPRP